MRIRPGVLLLGLGVLGAYAQSFWPVSGSSVSFVTVGQGDCTLIQENGFTMVIDTGGWFEGRDIGGRLALPFLRSHGVHKIDLLVLTHPDMDHVGGLKAFFRRYRVGRILIPARFASSLLMQDWLAVCGVPRDQIVWVKELYVFSVGTLSLRVDAPPFGNDAPDNDGSMVVEARWPSASFLLTGDAGVAVESWLVDRGQAHETVLKAGHHGSATSSSPPYLSAVHPEYTVISCGRTNHYGHPNAAALARLVSSSGQVFRTDREGDVTFWLSPSGVKVSRQRL